MKRYLFAVLILFSLSVKAQTNLKSNNDKSNQSAKELIISKSDIIEYGKIFQDYLKIRSESSKKILVDFFNKLVNKAGGIDKLFEMTKSYLVPTCWDLCDQKFTNCITGCCEHGAACCQDNTCYMEKMGCYAGCWMEN